MTKNILIVHSDEAISFLIEKMLDSIDTHFCSTNSYEEVVDIIQTKKFDIIITDSAVKGNFTFQYLEYLKTNANGTPIIVVSQIYQEHIVKVAKKIGVNEYIPMPFDPIDIKNRINSYL